MTAWNRLAASNKRAAKSSDAGSPISKMDFAQFQ
jgi:hypothetical protein